MRVTNKVWTALFALATLFAWATTAFLFFIVKRAPLARGEPLTIPMLANLLPWVSACVSWIKVRKSRRSALADGDTSSVCYSMIFSALAAAYVAVLSIELLLLDVLIKATSR
jgi:hypothetical protein